MRFEFDPEKSAKNREKHGIDFNDAQAIWNDPFLVEVPAKVSDEPRFLALGRIENKVWAAVFTYRGDQVRIISVRRARKREVDHYESI